MGNSIVHASSPDPQSPSPMADPLTANIDDIKDKTTSNNPGTLEELHKKCTDVFPTPFEGGKFVLNKGLSNHLQVSHNISLSSLPQQPSSYRFGATYVGTMLSPTDVKTLMVGDIDPSGNLNANVIHQWNQRLKSKFMGQLENNKFAATQITTDWKGDSSSASLTLGNFDPIGRSGVGVFHYLQKVSSRFSLGTELATQFGPQVPGGKVGMHSVAARYEGDDFEVAGTLGASGAHVSFRQQCSESLQVSTELETSSRGAAEAVATTGFALEMPKANCSIKGKIDTSGTVGCVVEKKLDPLPFTLALSALHNHVQDKFRVGVGFFIG